MALTAVCACQPNASHEPASNEKDETAPPTETPHVRVAPALLETGRIALVAVTPFAHAHATVVPGEVALAPDGEAEVGSLVAGRVSAIEVAEGTSVQRGQVLAWIDSPEVGSVRADLARAVAQVTAANKRLERQLALQSQGATSQGAVDEANAAVQTATADQQAARAKLNSVGVGGASVTGRIPLRSPIDGIVVERRATLGGAVAPDTTLFRVVNARRLRIKAQWSETLGVVPPVGTRVELSPRSRRSGVNASKPECAGVVESQLGVVNAETRSLTLQVRADDSCTTLTPGAYLDVIVAGPEATRQQAEDWTQVPLESVVDLRGIPTVFVATGEAGEFEARRVAPAPTVGGIVPIEIGLRAGEKVASKGVILLKGEALRDILGGE